MVPRDRPQIPDMGLVPVPPLWAQVHSPAHVQPEVYWNRLTHFPHPIPTHLVDLEGDSVPVALRHLGGLQEGDPQVLQGGALVDLLRAILENQLGTVTMVHHLLKVAVGVLIQVEQVIVVA